MVSSDPVCYKRSTRYFSTKASQFVCRLYYFTLYDQFSTVKPTYYIHLLHFLIAVQQVIPIICSYRGHIDMNSPQILWSTNVPWHISHGLAQLHSYHWHLPTAPVSQHVVSRITPYKTCTWL